jgi:hypothetical protein
MPTTLERTKRAPRTLAILMTNKKNLLLYKTTPFLTRFTSLTSRNHLTRFLATQARTTTAKAQVARLAITTKTFPE